MREHDLKKSNKFYLEINNLLANYIRIGLDGISNKFASNKQTQWEQLASLNDS